jgi:hypothetical protein
MRPLAFFATLACCLAAQDTSSTPFDFPDFANHPNLQTAGSAHYAANLLRLTDSREMQAGAVWYTGKEPPTAGFDTTFQFRLTAQGGLGPGADGFAFVLQNSGPSALAGRGSAGGWGVRDGQRDRTVPGIPRAIAIFFDTFRNNEDHDPSDNYIGIFTNGGPRDMKWPPHRLAYTRHLRIPLKDGAVHIARILFRPPLLSVYLDNQDKAVLVSPVDVSLVADPSGSGWVGFTASTGSGFENHDILSWSFQATDVSSAMVSSNISFFMDRCAPGHNLCTPDQPIVDETQPGRYHVVLPGNLEWGASVANPSGREVVVENARGTVCWDLAARGSDGCTTLSGGIANQKSPGSLIMKTERGRTYFSISDRHFADNEGYFEFDAIVK